MAFHFISSSPKIFLSQNYYSNLKIVRKKQFKNILHQDEVHHLFKMRSMAHKDQYVEAEKDGKLQEDCGDIATPHWVQVPPTAYGKTLGEFGLVICLWFS